MDKSFEKNSRWIDGRKAYRRLAFVKYQMKKECSICKAKTKLDVHHKDKNHSNNSKSNLQILCKLHHNKLHKKGKAGGGIYPRVKKHSEETKKKISNSALGEKNGFYGKNWKDFGGHPKGMLGKKHSKETLLKISKASKLRWKLKKENENVHHIRGN